MRSLTLSPPHAEHLHKLCLQLVSMTLVCLYCLIMLLSVFYLYGIDLFPFIVFQLICVVSWRCVCRTLQVNQLRKSRFFFPTDNKKNFNNSSTARVVTGRQGLIPVGETHTRVCAGLLPCKPWGPDLLRCTEKQTKTGKKWNPFFCVCVCVSVLFRFPLIFS